MSPATSTPRPTVNLVQKSQLARLLATENMTIEHSQSAKTASFDTNTRKLILPIWSKASEDLYDMLVAHEVGHALITPREDVYMPVCKRMSPTDPTKFFPYLNIVEDIRVDNEIKDRYPGVRRSYYNAFKELMERDFFQIAKYGGDLSSLPFGDRLNIHSKVGHLGFIDVPFDAEEQAIVDEAMSASSFDDVIAVAEKVWNKTRQRKEKQPDPKGTDTAPAGKKGEGEQDAPQSDAGTGDSESQGGNNNNPSQGQGPEPQSEQSQNGNTGKANNATTTAQTTTKTQEQSTDLKTVESLANGLAGLTSSDRYDTYGYYDMPRMNLDNIIFSYKRVMEDLGVMRADTSFCGDKIYAAVQDRNKNFVSNLVKQFEQKMAADECRRTRTAKSGQLDMRKIANYKFSDDLFVKNQIVADGKSHGMVFIMDWSGSMSEYLLPTVEQLLALCMFCRKMNIPFEVYAFTNSQPKIMADPYTAKMTSAQYHDYMTANGICSPDYSIKESVNYYGEKVKEIDCGNFLQITNFGMIQFLSSKMNTQEFKNAAELFCQCARNSDCSGSDLSKIGGYTTNMPRQYGLSSTPLNEAIYAGIDIVNRFKAANRLDIVNTVILTDGEPTSAICSRQNAYNSIVNLPNRKQMAIRTAQARSPYGGSVDEMLGLAEMFREVTGTNLISIRLSHSREASSLARIWSNGNAKEEQRMMTEWKDQDFFSYRSFGFTESFVIDAKTEIVDDDFLDDIKEGATVGVITRAFIKGNAKKASSRVLLSRFSDLIAKKVMA